MLAADGPSPAGKISAGPGEGVRCIRSFAAASLPEGTPLLRYPTGEEKERIGVPLSGNAEGRQGSLSPLQILQRGGSRCSWREVRFHAGPLSAASEASGGKRTCAQTDRDGVARLPAGGATESIRRRSREWEGPRGQPRGQRAGGARRAPRARHMGRVRSDEPRGHSRAALLAAVPSPTGSPYPVALCVRKPIASFSCANRLCAAERGRLRVLEAANPQ